MIVEITDSVVALEDISADDTKTLSHILKTIADRSPELFQIPDIKETNLTVEVQRNVKKWLRFQELELILNASMIDISDRWASGNGPLAIAFSANEVKNMIRAMFQNTERRSHILAQIK